MRNALERVSSAMANVISQLLSKKYDKTNAKSGSSRSLKATDRATSGSRPDTWKKRDELDHKQKAGAEILKSRRRTLGWRLLTIQNDVTSESIVTITVPHSGPKSSVAAKTKVSEIELIDGTEGILTVAEAPTMVRPASSSHPRSGGELYRLISEESAIMPPRVVTAQTYGIRGRAGGGGVIIDCG